MNLDDLTIGEAKKLAAIFSTNNGTNGFDSMLGKYVIVRTYSAGVWCGVLAQKSGNEIILTEARRMYRWWAAQSISLSGVALYGVIYGKSKIIEPVESVWLEAIEIIPVGAEVEKNLRGAPYVKAE